MAFGIAGAIRYLLMVSKYSSFIRNRVEVSTPLNSWKRGKQEPILLPYLDQNRIHCLVQEGAFLFDNNINPYSGDMYHENPLVLVASGFLMKHCATLIPVLFVLVDLLTAGLLYHMSKKFIKDLVGISVSIGHRFHKLINLCLFLVYK